MPGRTRPYVDGMTNTNKLTARNARTMIGCMVRHDGADLEILDVRHMGRGGWMLKLSNGAMLRPAEIR